jgi:HSP20 family molecular chaperone IbpA
MKRKKISEEEISEKEMKDIIRKSIDMFIKDIERLNEMIEKEMFVKDYSLIYVYNPFLKDDLVKEEKELISSVIDRKDKLMIIVDVNDKEYEIKIKDRKLIVSTEEGKCEVKLSDDVILDKRKEEYNNGILIITFEKKK